MEAVMTVIPKVGYYLVRCIGTGGIAVHLVGKDKTCTCGGNAASRCVHISAVAAYLQEGGAPAPVADKGDCVHDSKRTRGVAQTLDVCPFCGRRVTQLDPGVWRCPGDPAHYYRWRGERNGGAIRRFLTEPHPAKRGPFYAMSEGERESFLTRVARRMHKNGYTPHT